MNGKKLLYSLFGNVIIFSVFILCVLREYGSLTFLTALFPELFTGAVILIVAAIAGNILYIAAPLIVGLLKGYTFVSAEGFGFKITMDYEGKLSLKRKTGKVTYNTYMEPPEYDKWEAHYALYLFSRAIFFWVITVLIFICAIILFVMYYNMEAFYCFCVFSWFLVNSLLFTVPDGNINKFEKIRKLKSSADLRRAYWMSERVYTNLHKGIPVGDQPEEYFDCSYYESTADSITAETLWLKMNRLIDEGKPEEADKIIDIMLDEKCPIDLIRKQLSCLDRVTIRLIAGCSEDMLTDLLTDEILRFMRKNVSLVSVIRTEYVLALLYYKDMSSAENYRKRFEKTVRAYSCSADLRGELKLLQLAEDKAKYQ